MSCACKLGLLFRVVFCLIWAVRKFDLRFVIKSTPNTWWLVYRDTHMLLTVPACFLRKNITQISGPLCAVKVKSRSGESTTVAEVYGVCKVTCIHTDVSFSTADNEACHWKRLWAGYVRHDVPNIIHPFPDSELLWTHTGRQSKGLFHGVSSPRKFCVVIICTNCYNIQQFYVLPTQCVYVFCVDLRTNSDYFPIQH